MAEIINTGGLFDKFVGVIKQLALHIGLDAVLKDAAAQHTKSLTASFFPSLNFNDEAAFAIVKNKVFQKMKEAGGPILAAKDMAEFEAWFATQEVWRANCYKLIITTSGTADKQDSQMEVLNGMFTARSNAERDTIITNLLRDKPTMMKVGEYLEKNYAAPWEYIKAKFGDAYNWAQAELLPVIEAIPGQVDDFLGTTGVKMIRPACVNAKKGLRDALKLVRKHNGV